MKTLIKQANLTKKQVANYLNMKQPTKINFNNS